MPHTRKSMWLKKSPSEGTRTQPGSSSTPARGPGAALTSDAMPTDQRDTSPVNPHGSWAVKSNTLRPPSTAPAGSTGHAFTNKLCATDRRSSETLSGCEWLRDSGGTTMPARCSIDSTHT